MCYSLIARNGKKNFRMPGLPAVKKKHYDTGCRKYKCGSLNGGFATAGTATGATATISGTTNFNNLTVNSDSTLHPREL
jgi:hypothetical protein